MCGTILAKNIENNGDSADLREIFVPEPKPVMAGSVPGFKRYSRPCIRQMRDRANDDFIVYP
jgi:hypothetical protein